MIGYDVEHSFGLIRYRTTDSRSAKIIGLDLGRHLLAENADEEVQIHCSADRLHAEAGRDRYAH